MHTYYKIGLAALVLAGLTQSGAFAAFLNYSDLTLSPESYNNGSYSSGYFESNDFIYSYAGGDSGGYQWWAGMAYSNITDNTTPGYANQFSAITGGGLDSDAQTVAGETYVIAYQDTYQGINPSVDLNPESGSDIQIDGIYLTNTTYAYLAIKDGNDGSEYPYVKKFGGESGDDKDFFYVTITGYDKDYNQTGTYDFYLADYRFDDNDLDYVIDAWTYVDFKEAGFTMGTTSFTLEFVTSDVGEYGANTPFYAALGGMNVSVIPEPSAYAALFGALSLGFVLMRRRALKK